MRRRTPELLAICPAAGKNEWALVKVQPLLNEPSERMDDESKAAAPVAVKPVKTFRGATMYPSGQGS